MKTTKVTHDIMHALVQVGIHDDLQYTGGFFEVTLPDHIADAISIYSSSQFDANYAGMRLEEFLHKMCGPFNHT